MASETAFRPFFVTVEIAQQIAGHKEFVDNPDLRCLIPVKRMFEKSCQCQVHRTWYRLHVSSPEAEVSTYSTEFDGSQDFSTPSYFKA
jgi:hypothetical protein